MDFLIDKHSHTHTNKHIHIHTRVLYVNQEWKNVQFIHESVHTCILTTLTHTHSFTLFAATLSSHLTNSNTRLHSFIRLRSTWTQTHTYAHTYLHTFTHWMHQAHAHSLDHSLIHIWSSSTTSSKAITYYSLSLSLTNSFSSRSWSSIFM